MDSMASGGLTRCHGSQRHCIYLVVFCRNTFGLERLCVILVRDEGQ